MIWVAISTIIAIIGLIWFWRNAPWKFVPYLVYVSVVLSVGVYLFTKVFV